MRKTRERGLCTARDRIFGADSSSQGGKYDRSCSSGARKELDQAVARLESERSAASRDSYEQLLRQCGSSKSLLHGRRVHSHIATVGKSLLGPCLQNALVQMYGKCGSMKEALAVFSTIARKNTYSYNILISAAARNGLYREALDAFERMKREGIPRDKFTYADVITACCSLKDLARGRAVHAGLLVSGIQPDDFLRVALLNMYAKLGSLGEATRIFHSMPTDNVVAWNVMIAAFSQSDQPSLALEFYWKMLAGGTRPDFCTLISTLSAVSCLRRLSHGRAIHDSIQAHGYCSDVILDTALVDMYGKCGSLDDARMVFDKMPARDIVTWNAMIAAYSQHGQGDKAFELYAEMEPQGFKPELVTLVNLLTASCCLGDLSRGKAIHSRIIDDKLELTLVAENAIVNMYAKCGSLAQAKLAFDGMIHPRDVISWNAIIAGNAENGGTETSLQLAKDMVHDGVAPDATTFTCVLLCCSHGGQLDQGRSYFLSMVSDFQLSPSSAHYQSLIDLLGRAGRLEEAEELMSVMPYQPGVAGVRAYLGACRTHFDEERGSSAGELAWEMYPDDPSSYVLTSNIVRHTAK
ncbi:pentatricopeptide repeat-containing protein At1g11290, chloroplastic isoform X1 [Selaginella moellendorffii]|nr:pentatricopeptide repeat-containing protein At1g11290, chloroplastic isoform X1 [Selaginella moellendorffii]|eukprot:XP_002971551.2 pentatricopeptide repeat-containing protein At1g11290, chloroplastic isoform X1 [Selaginella moellendorffii]